MATDRLVFGMHHLNITQAGAGMTGGKNLSHISFELDLAGEDSGIDFWRNMMPNTYWIVAGKWGTSGTVFFWPCDKQGNGKKVLCADGVERYVTLAMTHSYADYKVGKILGYKDVMYQEGTKGFATGNHIHIECASGRTREKILKNGVYILEDMLDPRRVFFILDGYTTVKSTLGLSFKHCSEVTVQEEKVEGADLKAYFVAQGGSCQIRRLDTVNGKATFSKVVGVISKGEKVPFTGDSRKPTFNGYQMAQIYQQRTNTYGWVPLDMTTKDGDIMYAVEFEK